MVVVPADVCLATTWCQEGKAVTLASTRREGPAGREHAIVVVINNHDRRSFASDHGVRSPDEYPLSFQLDHSTLSMASMAGPRRHI